MTFPVVVTGPGRSGTTAVARVLAESLGVDMGLHLRNPALGHPGGSFEDDESRSWSLAVHRRRMNLAEYRDNVVALKRRRRARWGVKDPTLCYLLDVWSDAYPGAALVIADRDPELTAASWNRNGFGTLDDVRDEINRRRESLYRVADSWRGPVRSFDFTTWIEPVEIERRLGALIGRPPPGPGGRGGRIPGRPIP